MLTRFSYRSIFAPIVLLCAVIAFFLPEILMGQALAGSDFQQIHYPLVQFVVRTVQDTGTIPLWNPHQFLGYSVVGNPQYGLFYPPNWLLLFFRDAAIFDGILFLVVLHIWWLAFGTYTFAKIWGANTNSAIMAALLVAFSTFTISKVYAGHYAVILTLSWLPWLWCGTTYTLKQQTLRSILPGSIALGFAILAGHPQYVYIALIGSSLLALVHLIEQRPKIEWQAIRQISLMVFFGVILGAVTWLPAFAYQSQTVRGQAEDSLQFANQHAIPLRQLSTLIVPDIFGNPTTDAGYWGEPFYEEMTANIGLLPLVLLYFAFAWRMSKQNTFILFVIVGLWLSLGADVGLYRVLYTLVPPARGFRAPGRFLILVVMGLAILSALILTRLQDDSTPALRLPTFLRRVALPGLIILWGASIAYALIGNDLQADTGQAAFVGQQFLISALFFSAIVGLIAAKERFSKMAIYSLLVIAVVNVAWVSWSLKNTDDVEVSPVWQQAASIIPDAADGEYARVSQIGTPAGIINGASWTGHFSPQGYDPIAPQGWFELMDATGIYIQEPGSATNRLFSVRYVITNEPLENYNLATAQYFNLIADDPYYIYDNPLTLPRVYVSGQAIVEPNTGQAIQRIQNGEVDRGDVVIIDTEPNCNLDGEMGTATIRSYTSNSVSIETQHTSDGILVLADQYDPDWQVWVDGEQQTLLRINTTMRGVVCVCRNASG